MSAKKPRRDLRLKTGYTKAPNFFLIFWAPYLGPAASILYLQLLRLSFSMTQDVIITIARLKQFLCVRDNRTVWRLLRLLEKNRFITISDNGKSRFLHRLQIRVINDVRYLPENVLADLPPELQKLYQRYLAMSDLSPHELLNNENLMGMSTISIPDLMGMNTISDDVLMVMNTIRDANLMGMNTIEHMGMNTITPLIDSIIARAHARDSITDISINNNGSDVCVFRSALLQSKKFRESNYHALVDLLKKHNRSLEHGAQVVAYADEKYRDKEVSNPTGLLTRFLPHPVPTEWKRKQKKKEASRIRHAIERQREIKKSRESQKQFEHDLKKAKSIWRRMSSDDQAAIISRLKESAINNGFIPESAFSDPFSSVWLCPVIVDEILKKSRLSA